MTKSLRSLIAPHTPALVAAFVLLAAGLTGCASNAAAAKPSRVSDADFARLAEGASKPVDEARLALADARDELGRAQLGVVNDQHEGAFARSDQAAASAGLSRADAETQVGKDSNEPGQKQMAAADTRAAQQDKGAADAHLAYSKKLAASRAAQVTAAERKVDLMTEKVYAAKLQALVDAGVPAAGKYDQAAALERVAGAQRALDVATAHAAEASRATAEAQARWQPPGK